MKYAWRMLLLAAALALGFGAFPSASEPPALERQRSEGQRILKRAQAWTAKGGAEAVRSLSIRGTLGPRGQTQRLYDVDILGPDRCQIRQDGGWVHTLNRAAFWMTIPPEFRPIFNPDMQATAERSTRQKCVELLTAFLLEPFAGLGVEVAAVGPVVGTHLKGEGVRVSLPGQGGNIFVFDVTDGRPLGYVRHSATSDVPLDKRDHVIFTAYATVQRWRVPGAVEYRYPSTAAIVDWTITEIVANDVTAAAFVPKSPGL